MHTKTTLAREEVDMAELIISLIAVSILGHHIDESKIKKYMR